jgi:4'-phosphopantetheinyl transferase
VTEGEVQLWYGFTDEVCPEDLESCRALLPPEEMARHDRLMKEDDRVRFVVAHALARRALSSYADVPPESWRFESGEHGKPEISAPANSKLRFNISHAAGLCACAVTLQHDVGVDVENVHRRAKKEEIARRYFADEEAGIVERRPELFFDYWTLKEAYIKAHGRGLAMGLSSFSFDLTDGIEFSGPDGWSFFRHRPHPDYRAAVAARGPNLSFVVREAVSLLHEERTRIDS